VHPSNYRIEGFQQEVAIDELAALARAHGVAVIHDIGSGALRPLDHLGIAAREPTATDSIEAGADLVLFSGDKLLGGPQAGIIVGRRELIRRIKQNPMKRAMRLDKVTIAALAATLPLYADPDRLPERLPTLRLLARPLAEIRALAERLAPALSARLGEAVAVRVVACRSQIGSGSLPAERLPSQALVIRPAGGKRAGAALKSIAASFRALPVPVIGRIPDDAFWLDLRCLEPDDEAAFLAQLDKLALDKGARS